MNLKEFSFLVVVLFLFSCGQDSNPGGGLGEDGDDNESLTLTQEQLDGLNSKCISEANSIQLPPALNIPANYASNEYAAEVWAAATFSKAIITTLSASIFPTAGAKLASTDGFTIFDNKEAYSWGVYPEKFVYVATSNGYEIYVFTSADDILGRELIVVRQNEDCSQFELYQRATESTEYLEKGDIAFRFRYVQQGTQTYEFSDASSGDSRTYLMRSFAGLDGDLSITDESDDSLVEIDWTEDGDGIWQRNVDGVVVDSGAWEF